MDETINLLEFLNEPLKIDKPIRLIELFAGYGSQALSLKYLGVPFEHWKIAEWNYKSFDAYNKLHFADSTDYSKGKSKEWLIDYLSKKNISADWNKPMSYEQIKRLSEHQIRKIYNDIQATHNLVDISQATANDLDINDNRYCYIMTYSFPCQDLSLAGKRAGMDRGEGTRSGLLWEVERLLKECKKKPDILLMENVIQVHSEQNISNFRDWMISLEKMGYESYWQDMIGTDYGMPQIRNRTFMVSLLGNYFYKFPKPMTLKKKLKDLLETNVDEKYNLSEEMMEGMKKTNFQSYSFDSDYAFIQIINATKQGYLEAEEGDGVDISTRMKHHRGTVQKGKSQTLSTMGGGENQGVVIANEQE